MSKITTIIWDLDGTLLDSFGIHEDIMAQVLPRHGREVPAREWMLKNFHGKLEETIGNTIGNPPKEELAAIIQDFLAIDNEYVKEVNDHLFPDAVAFAQQAHQKGVQQVIVTNRAHGVNRGTASPRNMVEMSALSGLIDQVICGDESDFRKPDPQVLAPLGVLAPEKTLVIGDQFVDAEFAHNLKAQGLLVSRHDEVPHLERLSDGWQDHVQIVPNLFGILL